MAREWLSYDPRSPESERIEWWESNKSGALQDVCRRMLSELTLSKSFSEYWIGCFLSDHLEGTTVRRERIRWPADWLASINPLPLPDPVPPGCMRIEVDQYRYYRGDEVIQDPSLADSIRVFPPPLVSVIIPKWFCTSVKGRLDITLLPAAQWRQHWNDRSYLPLLADLPGDAVPVYRMTNSRGGANEDFYSWVPMFNVEIAPWSLSEEAMSLAHDQLRAVREWQEHLGLHDMTRCLKWAAAKLSASRTEIPTEWYTWLDEFQNGEVSYVDLVERVYWFRTGGAIPRLVETQSADARSTADWVGKQLRRQGLPKEKLPRYWWKNIRYRGPE